MTTMTTIGIDFDNTIVSYDEVFYKYAVQKGLVPGDRIIRKEAVRDHIRSLPDGNAQWTELQGLVYGRYMGEAQPMTGVEQFLAQCRKNSFAVKIISHKTVYPFIGPRVNLRDAARNWLRSRSFLSQSGLEDGDVIFADTLSEKLEKIAQERCRYFIDDLPEVLGHTDFPAGVEKILYGNQDRRGLAPDIKLFKGWNEIAQYVFG